LQLLAIIVLRTYRGQTADAETQTPRDTLSDNKGL